MKAVTLLAAAASASSLEGRASAVMPGAPARPDTTCALRQGACLRGVMSMRRSSLRRRAHVRTPSGPHSAAFTMCMRCLNPDM